MDPNTGKINNIGNIKQIKKIKSGRVIRTFNILALIANNWMNSLVFIFSLVFLFICKILLLRVFDEDTISPSWYELCLSICCKE